MSTPSASPARYSLSWLLGLVLALVTIALYWPVRTHDFLLMDDPDYVYRNPHVSSGLTLENIAWAFTHSHSSNWHPLTWISHMLDCQWFGVQAGAHHLVNVAIHAINSLVLLLLLGRLTSALWPSALAAALFALHPLHVESVAWIAERKDVLSTLFWFLTTWAYLNSFPVRSPPAADAPASVQSPAFDARALAWYCLALVLFACGLMSKPMLVTLPFTLLLLDFWPLQRFEGSAARPLKTLWLRVWEKLPFFALALASCIITMRVQATFGAVVGLNDLPAGLRLQNVAVSYVRYLAMTFAPLKLSIFYPFPSAISGWVVGGALLLLGAITIWALKLAKSRPYFLFGWLWYLGTLVPVIGLIKVGEQAMADRYTYVPLIGIFVAIGWGIYELSAKVPRLRNWIGAGAVAALVVCGVLSSRQIAVWKDSDTLYRHAAAVTPRNYAAMMILSDLRREQGRLAEAKALALEGLSYAPRSPDLHQSMGFILIAEKQYDDAASHFEQTLSTEPDTQRAWYGLAFCRLQQQRYADAEAAARKAWTLYADDYKAGLLLGMALGRQQKQTQAEATYREVLRRKPGFAAALQELALLLASTDRTEEALGLYRQAVEAEPSNLEGRNALANALAIQGDIPGAVQQYSESLRLDPNQAAILCALAELLSRLQRTSEAIAHYREALRLDPDLKVALNNLAWLLATHKEQHFRDGAEAVQLAERACARSGNKEPFLLGTLAAAYAEAGRFQEAVATAEKARDLASESGLKEVAARNTELLEFYKAERPFRE